MKFYIFLPKDFDCSLLNGNVDVSSFGLLHLTLDEVVSDELFDSDKHFVASIEFTDNKDIMNAIMSAYMGNTYKKFNIRILETIVVTDQGRIHGKYAFV